MEMPTKTLKGAATFKDAPTFKDQRRERIIQVARSVFYEVGYAGASMSMISSRLGGAKASLYAYFNSKEDLFEAIIREQCGQIADLFLAHTGTDDLRATLGKELHSRLATMNEHMTRVGKNLATANSAYNQMVGSFESQVLSQAKRFEALGAGSAKTLDTPPMVEIAPRPLTKLGGGKADNDEPPHIAAQ